jgi:hypothetical protein
MKNKYKLDELILTKIPYIHPLGFNSFTTSTEINGEIIDLPCKMEFFNTLDIHNFADLMDMKLTVLED